MDFSDKEWPLVSLTIEPSGKAPKHYGEGVYRFSAPMTFSVLLPRRGWILFKKSKNYAYLKPPSELSKPPFQIDIKIPTQLQALEIAKKFYVRGESRATQIGEWPVCYLHERKRSVQMMSYAGEGTYTTQQLDAGPPESILIMGEYGTWRVELRTTDGNFSFYESGDYKIQSASEEPTLSEGEQSEITLTKYERSGQAREACLKFYGYSCNACGFNFESVYGNIGKEFIHVHHIVPISEQGGEYKVNPIRDLIPLCANCHSIVHRQIPPLSIPELRALLSNSK